MALGRYLIFGDWARKYVSQGHPTTVPLATQLPRNTEPEDLDQRCIGWSRNYFGLVSEASRNKAQTLSQLGFVPH